MFIWLQTNKELAEHAHGSWSLPWYTTRSTNYQNFEIPEGIN